MTTFSPALPRGETSEARTRVRVLLLLLPYLAGSAVVAALLAAGLGMAVQELLGWALPYVTPRSPVG